MHRRLAPLILLALIASLLGPAAVTRAASFRSLVAQVPPAPAPSSTVRIWMNSDTAPGETAGLEYQIGSNYTKVLGTYDTSYSGANWRADIPAQPAGTLVAYQLFTRNEFGNDYGFSGFNWNYIVSGQSCAGAAVGDNNLFYAGLLHDSFATDYRSPLGPVTTAQGTVTLKARTCRDDAAQVSLRVWNDRLNSETIVPMTLAGHATDPVAGPVSYWSADLPVSTEPTVFYYIFRVSDGTATAFYRDDNTQFLGGGYGQADANQGSAEANSFQLTIYDPAFSVPNWMQRAVVYQIFPDRFRDGSPANNPAAGRFSYARAGGAIVRSNDPEGDWNTTVCDPRNRQGAGFNCPDHYGDNFYGGDLRGITQKIEDGYFSNLGVTVLYLNPIFRAPSNHKYDTANFMEIDPDFGTLADFQALVAAANTRGIRIMLDGVFNHTSSDSPYFDRYNRYNAASQLANPNGGANDGSGACEAVSSQFRGWFYFEGDLNTTINNPGQDNSTIVRCADGSGNPTRSYEAWYGYSSLPKIRSGLAAVRDYFYSGGSSAVGPYWTAQGASGWRFDVGADVDPGVTNDANNSYWEGFRAAVRNPALAGKSDTVMLGEEWGDASPWLLGGEWDSVMNYRFRSAVLSWLFTGCSGDGCAGGSKFQENDSNDNSSSGSIASLSPSLFNARLRSIQEDYPPMAFKAMMNLAGSHDTQRLRFLLKKINNDSDAAAVQRIKEWWLFAFSYAGAPTLYYGDEVGLSHDGIWDGTQFQDDPYNRAPFPWPDASGSAYTPDTANLQAFARHMASVRHSYRALQDGDVQHGLIIDDANKLYGFARTNGSQTALIALNRDDVAHSATFSGLNAAPYNLPDGTVLIDAVGGGTVTVAGGQATVNVNPSWGVVLLEQAKIAAPAAPSGLQARRSGGDIVLSWSAVTADSGGQRAVATGYRVYRGNTANFTPGPSNQIATVTPPAFGSTGGVAYTDSGAAAGSYYRVQATNASGAVSASSVGVTADETAPDTTLTSTPPAASTSTSASFSFSGSDDTTPSGSLTFECSLDNGAFSVCASPQSYPSLADGQHTFRVRAKDAAGNIDATPASFAWTIDTASPDTTLTGQPVSPTPSTVATFTFTGTDASTPPGSLRFECKLDSGTFAPCTSPQHYAGLLARTNHTFQVRAIDPAGNTDPSPATYTWAIDGGVPSPNDPQTTLTSAPPAVANTGAATFQFSGTDDTTPAGSLTFMCSLDNGPFAACTSPQSYASLSEGSHLFQVYAMDSDNRTDTSPAAHAWTVDQTTPDTAITTKPTGISASTSALFGFTGSDNLSAAGSLTFECSLDGAPFAACVSTKNYSSLSQGSHTFQVRAVDAAGNIDGTPASFTWVVDTLPPETTLLTHPPAFTTSANASFTFSSTDSGTGAPGFECSLDGAPFSTCVTPIEFTALAEGPHTFQVRAKDNAGIVDPTPAGFNWVIDTLVPDTAIDSAPADPSDSPTADFRFSGNDGSGSGVTGYECSLDGGPFAPCPAVARFVGLAEGEHTLAVRAVDAAGNVDPSPASHSWTIVAPPFRLVYLPLVKR
ncbi:MAG TPA: alpha-amylase family glycosyl hydrolase [Roseiflexaceae bacterium]|nr:alpha-amylase family glycosyl hydrolase [Roseiflexaceae bacterium]